MPLVPKTKMVDTRKQSLRNPLAKRTTWLVPKTTSATSISSGVFGAYSMTRILYKYAHLPTLTLFSYFHLQGQHTLSSVTSRENTIILISTNSSIPPQKYICHATILLLVTPFWWDFFHSQKQQKFRQTTKRKKQITWEKTCSSSYTLLSFFRKYC